MLQQSVQSEARKSDDNERNGKKRDIFKISIEIKKRKIEKGCGSNFWCLNTHVLRCVSLSLMKRQACLLRSDDASESRRDSDVLQ